MPNTYLCVDGPYHGVGVTLPDGEDSLVVGLPHKPEFRFAPPKPRSTDFVIQRGVYRLGHDERYGEVLVWQGQI